MKNVKKIIPLALVVILVLSLAACSPSPSKNTKPIDDTQPADTEPAIEHGTVEETVVTVTLSDNGVLVNDEPAATTGDVYVANDIVYYEADKDFSYGEGSDSDAHSVEEAAAHTVVHIKAPGTFYLSGSLSAGQIAIDLGEDAKKDPTAVVNLYLNGVDITNTVAPAIIFYNVYECGSDDAETATNTVDTSAAGANLYIVGGTVNNINGSHVARIYKPDSVVLNAEGTAVEEAKKLHKYDAAVYSRMSMNVNSWNGESGILNIVADNEGLDTELHLTINGGNVNIRSGNDGINTNEDGVSVTTINGGEVNIIVTGETGEGDGIDSNGWLVINGGVVKAQACYFSMDAGIDSDMGIHINGGTVCATGNMLDRIENGGQTFAVFEFDSLMMGAFSLKDSNDNVVAQFAPENGFKYMLMSSGSMVPGDYTLWEDFGTQYEGYATSSMNGFGGRPDGFMPDGVHFPENIQPGETPPNFPAGNFAEMTPPPGGDFEIPNPPEGSDDIQNKTNDKAKREDNMKQDKQNKGDKVPRDESNAVVEIETSPIFTIQEGANYFRIVLPKN